MPDIFQKKYNFTPSINKPKLKHEQFHTNTTNFNPGRVLFTIGNVLTHPRRRPGC